MGITTVLGPIALMLGVGVSMAARADAESTSAHPGHPAIGSGRGTLEALQKHLQPFHVRVVRDEHGVVLRGTVASEVERDLAATIAGSIEGHGRLRNEIRRASCRERV